MSLMVTGDVMSMWWQLHRIDIAKGLLGICHWLAMYSSQHSCTVAWMCDVQLVKQFTMQTWKRLSTVLQYCIWHSDQTYYQYKSNATVASAIVLGSCWESKVVIAFFTSLLHLSQTSCWFRVSATSRIWILNTPEFHRVLLSFVLTEWLL